MVKTNQDPDQYTIIPVPLKIIKVLIEELSSSSGGGNSSQFALMDAASAVMAASLSNSLHTNGVDPNSLSADTHTNNPNDDNNNNPDDDDDEEDDGDWEDLSGSQTLDLSLGSTKQALMSFGDGTGSFLSGRQRDDETQAFLIEFFRDVSNRNVGRFGELYGALTEGEREKLNAIGGG